MKNVPSHFEFVYLMHLHVSNTRESICVWICCTCVCVNFVVKYVVLSVMYIIIWVVAYAVLVAADRNCRVNGLSDTLEIPGTEHFISVGDRLARTASSYICKVLDNPELLIKIERQQLRGNNSLHQEAIILAEIQHLNISPNVYWEGVFGGKSLLVFEYVHGPTLYDYFSSSYKQTTHLWQNELIDFSIKQIQMLRLLHEDGGYIHGDTHTNNWIVLPLGELKLIDFGKSVKVTSPDGKDHYYGRPLHWMLSPWEIARKPLDKRDDIYRAIINVFNILNSGATSEYFKTIENDRQSSFDEKLTGRDLINPAIPPGPLTRLIQGMRANSAPPYFEIIALLESMKIRPAADAVSPLTIASVEPVNEDVPLATFADLVLSPRVISVAKRDAMINISLLPENVPAARSKFDNKPAGLKKVRSEWFRKINIYKEPNRPIFTRRFKDPVQATN